MLPVVRFVHEDGVRGAHRPMFGERLGGHVDGPVVRLSLLAQFHTFSLVGPAEVLPRRFRSSALRACGAGRLAIDIGATFRSRNLRYVITLSPPIANEAELSYPQFVSTGSDGTCAWGVPSNTRIAQKRVACARQ